MKPDLVPDDMVEVVADSFYTAPSGGQFVTPAAFEEGCQRRARDVLAAAFDAPSMSRHFVTFGYRGWSVEHSAECRLSGVMSHGNCPFEEAVVAMGLPDADQMGRWCITSIDDEGLPSLTREEAS